MTAPTPDPSREVDRNPRDCTCEYVHASEPTCRSVEPSSGAVHDSERTFPVSREDREALLVTALTEWFETQLTYDAFMHQDNATMGKSAADAVLPILDRLTADADRAGYERGRREALEEAAKRPRKPPPDWGEDATWGGLQV